MNHTETKLEKIQRERNELVIQVTIVEKAVSLLRNSGANAFIELVKEWVKYIEQTLITLDPLDKNFQLEYNGKKETRDFLCARLEGLDRADENLIGVQKSLQKKEIELKKQSQIIKETEQNRF